MNSSLSSKCWILVVFVLSFIVVLPTLPVFGNLPLGDAAVYIYNAKAMLRGEILYVEVIEHKPPGVYFINALGLLLAPTSFWGVWALEYFTIAIAAWFGLNIMKNMFGSFSAVTATVFWLISFVYLNDKGNYVEFYGLFFQFISLYLFMKIESGRGSFLWMYFLIGCATAGSFLFRTNLIGIQTVVFFFLLYKFLLTKKKDRSLLPVIVFIGGFFSCILPWIIFFIAQNSVEAAISAIFIINIYYSASPITAKIAAAIYGMIIYFVTGIGFCVLLGFVVAAKAFVRKEKYVMTNKLLLIAMIDLPIEIILSSVSGRPYPHYYVPWLPSIAILTAFFVSWYRIYVFNKLKHKYMRVINSYIYIACILMFFISSLVYSIIMFKSNLEYSKFFYGISEKIKQTTNKNDVILSWGHNSTLYLSTDRMAVGKYVYQMSLFLRGYGSSAMKVFYKDLVKRPPKYIIDSTQLAYTFPSFDNERRLRWIPTRFVYDDNKEFDRVVHFVNKNYFFVETLENGWRVYRLKRE